MFKRENLLLLFVIIILGLVPFFWLKPGEIDIGGDASRLYFVDPIAYLINFSLFYIGSQGTGIVEPNFFSIPFLLLLILITQFVSSPYLLITLFSSFKIVTAFLSVFFIIKTLLDSSRLKKTAIYFSSLLGGIFYVLTPTMTGNWDRALISHNQVFINPLVFLLLLKFIKTGEDKFIWLMLLVSFIFSSSFAYTSAPPFFAFFPLAIIFLFIYSLLSKNKIQYKKLILVFLLFLGLQSFHLIPQVVSFLDPGSYTNTRFFDREAIFDEGIRYFDSILTISRLSNYALLSYGPLYQPIVTPLFLITVLFGFFLNKKIRKLMVLAAIFYLITLFLLSGKITNLGTDIYRLLFYVPGFSMFRNFIGQWLFVFSFFSALLFGFSLASIFERVNRRIIIIFTILISGVLIMTSWYFVTGDIVNRIIFSKNNTRISHKIDSDFQKTLDYVKKIPTDSKLLVLPLTDAYYQVVPGENDKGVYIGPSAFSYLGGKKDFVGHQILSPFSEDFLNLVKEEKYEQLNELLGVLNIHYIVHNSSEFILGNNNEDFLYYHVGSFLPNSQKDYTKLIQSLNAKIVAEYGSYKIYQLPTIKKYRHIYSSEDLIVVDKNSSISSILNSSISEESKIFLFSDQCKNLDCKNLKLTEPEISFQKISPIEYKVFMKNVDSDYLLIFSESFHKEWKAYIDIKSDLDLPKMVDETEAIQNKNYLGFNFFDKFFKESIDENRHFVANYYANGWLITPDDANYKSKYIITLKLHLQEIFYFSCLITLFSLVIFLIWGYNIMRNKK